MDEICIWGLATATTAFRGFIVFVWGVAKIILQNIFGTKSAANWRRKLGLAQSSNQAGSTTSPISNTKLYWLFIRVIKNKLPVATAKVTAN
jgi:hypothetical protein